MSTLPKLVGYVDKETGFFISPKNYLDLSPNQIDKYEPVFTNPMAVGDETSFGAGFIKGLQEAILYHKREANAYSSPGRVDGMSSAFAQGQQVKHIKVLKAILELYTGASDVGFLVNETPEEFAKNFTMQFENDATYVPSDGERVLIADAIEAFMSEKRVGKLRLQVAGNL